MMTDAIIDSAPKRKRRWRVPAIVLIPIYLMLAGLVLRYAVYARTSGHWGFEEYFRALCVYDCNAYERLALNGYEGRPSGFDKGDANNWAFFPLFSILSWTLSRLSSLSVLLAATALANALSVWAAIISWPLFEQKLRPYIVFCAFIFIGPFSYYFTTPYTESLFLLLTIGGFTLLKQRDYIGAGILGALMSATRSTGLVFIAAILITALIDYRRDGGRTRDFFRGLWRRTDLILAIALVPIGISIFAIYLWYHSGDALAFVHIQRAWGRTFQNPFGNLWQALSVQFRNHSATPITTDLAFGLAAIAGFIFAAIMAWRRQWAEAVFTLFAVLLPLSTNTYSMVRFVVALPPILILVSSLIGERKWLFYLALPTFVILDVLWLPTWISRSYYLM